MLKCLAEQVSTITNKGVKKSMMKLTPSALRIIVCSLIGLGLIFTGINEMQTANLVEMAYAPFLVAIGTFMLLFAFRPSLGRDIIKAVTSMLRRH